PGFFPAATAQQGIEFALVAGFSGDLKVKLVPALRVVARLIAPDVTGIFLSGGIGHDQSVKTEGVTEGETGRPQLAARARRQHRPKTAEQVSGRRRPFEDQPAAIYQDLSSTE